MKKPLLRALLTYTLLAMIVTGCGGNDDDDVETGTGDEADFESPLADYVGLNVSFGIDESAEAEAQEQIVTCMAAEGFDYTPQVTDVSLFEDAERADGIEPGSKEYAEKYGFGITTEAFPQSAVGPNLVGGDQGQDFLFGFEDSGSDPNSDYVESLSEAEQEAYYAALYGDFSGPDIDQSMTEEEVEAAFEAFNEVLEPSGCFDQAYDDLYGDDNMEAFYEEFGDQLDALYEDVENHPRVVAFEADLAECVTDKGQTYIDQSELYETFSAKLGPVQEGFWQQMDQAMSAVEFDENGRPPAGFQMPEIELSDSDKATLGDLQKEEIELAIAYFDCGGTEQRAGEVFSEARIEIEQQFIDANRSELDAFKAANA